MRPRDKPKHETRVLYVDEEQDVDTAARLFLRLGALGAGAKLRLAVAQQESEPEPELAATLANAEDQRRER
jgi:hypothetical protein